MDCYREFLEEVACFKCVLSCISQKVPTQSPFLPNSGLARNEISPESKYFQQELNLDLADKRQIRNELIFPQISLYSQYIHAVRLSVNSHSKPHRKRRFLATSYSSNDFKRFQVGSTWNRLKLLLELSIDGSFYSFRFPLISKKGALVSHSISSYVRSIIVRKGTHEMQRANYSLQCEYQYLRA